MTPHAFDYLMFALESLLVLMVAASFARVLSDAVLAMREEWRKR